MSAAASMQRALPPSSVPSQAEIQLIAPDETRELAAQIAPLHARLFNPRWQGNACHDLLKLHASTSFVATMIPPPGSTETHTVAGFIIGRIAADEAEILTIGVAPDLQNHRLGRRLLQALVDRLKAQDANRLFLEVAATNAPAFALYQSGGFMQVGQRSNYYAPAGGKSGDAVVLARDL